MRKLRLTLLLTLPLMCLIATTWASGEHEAPRKIEYAPTPPAPAHQTWEDAAAKSHGCVSCHTDSDQKTMHSSSAVVLGCTDCHGGDAYVAWEGADAAVEHSGGAGEDHSGEHGSDRNYAPDYRRLMDGAHVQPLYPESWHYPSSANPPVSYTLLNREASEYVRFVNPGDYRVAQEACGACHAWQIQAAVRSLHSTSAHFWAAAAYNNGILPFKRSILGENYTPDGVAAALQNPVEVTDKMIKAGIRPIVYPLPAWETIPPADVFRVFERGGRNLGNLFPETGLPNSLPSIQRLEEPGRFDIRQSNRGLGTGNRVAIPVLNLTKTRLNDPHMWFLGTNDQPGDYRSSGCSGCHVIYANDADPRHSGPYAQYGHWGESQSADPTIPRDERGHPLRHEFTRKVPTAMCMTCHMHQPNLFINTYLGYTMWDYESDAAMMWPEEQQYPDAHTIRQVNERNPNAAAPRGKWADVEFFDVLQEMNRDMKDTQFADYHGHGWNFRAIFKRARDGTLLDAQGNAVADDDPDKFSKAVHMSSIHLDVGMHCVDCHFTQDNHGNGHLYGEVQGAIEIQCQDCHGTADEYPSLFTTGPSAPPGGNNLALIRNPDGKRRFEWRGDKLYQRSLINDDLEWELSLVKDSVTPGHDNYNPKAARAKLMSSDLSMDWGPGITADARAHKDDEMLCFTCHTSWTTSCAGCHLPIEANWKTERHHFEGGTTRSYATYNPQVVRDQMFQLAIHGELKDNKIAPVASRSGLVLSSTNSNREKIYIQQPPIAASGYSSQAFATHFPHTARKTETKTCTDCHLSEENDNNAIMAQLLLLGTDFVDFVGYNAWVGGDGEITAVRVTEWDEPQSVIGSYLQRYAYPDWYGEHQARGRVLEEAYGHRTGTVGCLQLRGEYLYVAHGNKGTQVFDVASIANKGVSQRIITAPFSPLGHDTRVESRNATCVSLVTTQPVQPSRNQGDLMRDTNLEQPFHPIYNYMFITDTEEGLILVDIDTMMDRDPRNNKLKRALTWNDNGILNGARHINMAGYYAYITTPRGVITLNLDDPLQPRLVAEIPLRDARATATQFRYLFVTFGDGFQVVDTTDPEQPRIVDGAFVPLDDARGLHVARTYAYVAARGQGLAIIDVTRTEQPTVYKMYDAGGAINDAFDVTVASTNASLFAYVADGANGLRVIQLTSPDSQPKFYGFSPAPKPELIASYATAKPALSLSRPLERDRGVDETGGQIAVFGRIGSRPFNLEEMRRFYLDAQGKPWTVSDEVDDARIVILPLSTTTPPP